VGQLASLGLALAWPPERQQALLEHLGTSKLVLLFLNQRKSEQESQHTQPHQALVVLLLQVHLLHWLLQDFQMELRTPLL
jgi:hypothetical protein